MYYYLSKHLPQTANRAVDVEGISHADQNVFDLLLFRKFNYISGLKWLDSKIDIYLEFYGRIPHVNYNGLIKVFMILFVRFKAILIFFVKSQ